MKKVKIAPTTCDVAMEETYVKKRKDRKLYHRILSAGTGVVGVSGYDYNIPILEIENTYKLQTSDTLLAATGDNCVYPLYAIGAILFIMPIVWVSLRRKSEKGGLTDF